VQKQQGKQISIDLFMNKKSLTVACVCVDITTASRQHPIALSNSLFQHVHPPGVFNTLMVRGRSNMGVRYGVYQHVLLDVFDSPAKCLNLAMFCGTNHNTTHSNIDAGIHIHGKAMRQQQGEKDMGTLLFVLVSIH
jgi:hypothetical protein